MMNTPNDSFSDLQAKTMRLLCYLCWVHVPILALIATLVGAPLVWITAISAALAAAADLMVRAGARQAAVTLAIALTGQAALLTATFADHPWQVDSHMYFFAMLAILSALIDMRAIIASTAIVAVHHLALNFIAPGLIYPGGSDLGRTVMHAVILLAEAGILLLITHERLKLRNRSAAARKEAEAHAVEAAEALKGQEEAEKMSAQTRDQTLATVEAEFGVMVDAGLEGNFQHRIETRFDDDVMNALAERLNALFSSMDSTLGQLEHSLDGVAEGDLSKSMETALSGRFEQLRQRVNGTIASLRAVAEQIHTATDASRQTATGISRDATELSRRNESQAASIEETSASMEELAATVQTNSARLTEAETHAQNLSQNAAEGSEVVDRAIAAVEQIEKSSDRITEIISVIDAIAFQTNLLALNAAVEAARAGEAGRGFAVVASEVRTLAQRSSDAARDISALIQESTANVSNGVGMVQETGQILRQITSSLGELTANITSVAEAGRTQATSLSEMRTVITSIDEIIQSNSGLADSGATAAQTLQSHIARLAEVVDKLDKRPAETRLAS